MACLAAERLGRAPSHGILPPGSHASRVRQAGNAHSCTPAGPSFPRRGCGVQEPVPNCHQRPPLPTPHWDASPASVCHHGAVPVTETLSHPVAAAVGLFLQGGGSRQWGSHAWGAGGAIPAADAISGLGRPGRWEITSAEQRPSRPARDVQQGAELCLSHRD